MAATLRDDELLFADDEHTDEAISDGGRSWKVLIVDDAPEIHVVTKLALEGFEFAGRQLEFFSAYSGKEAMELAAAHPDAAMMLLDVVMENDHAGLDVARHVREELGNSFMRIVLRTGQPGQAPEHKVISDYDINDYKEKTELTATKMYTLMYSVLRSFRDIMVIEANKRGLEKVIEASADIFGIRSMEHFTKGVLGQLTSMLHLDEDAVYCKVDGLAASHRDGNFNILAGTGSYDEHVGEDASKIAPDAVVEDLRQALMAQRNLYKDDRFVGFCHGEAAGEHLLCLSGVGNVSDLDQSLIQLFNRNVSIAFDNIHLQAEIEETQREIVYMLGEAVETRSRETGNHVKRVAEISKLLALETGLGEDEAEIVRLASPLHDVGKIGIPDYILNKPGKHTPEEWEVMQTHAMLGHEMLKNSKKRILRSGAEIALEHHEKWNGQGYPYGKKQDEIALVGRITAVADVFDALGSDRCYKKAWPLDRIIDLLKEERGEHFDPALVDNLLANMDKIVNIRDRYVDVMN